jgi:tetratricopeptide (TPR) repeat protein
MRCSRTAAAPRTECPLNGIVRPGRCPASKRGDARIRWKTTIISLAAVLLAGTANARVAAKIERCTNATPDITIVACTTIISSGLQTTTEKLARTFNDRGVAYVDKREYDRAIEDFDQAIKLDPNYALAFNNRGIAYADKGQYDRTSRTTITPDSSIRMAPSTSTSTNPRGRK